MTRSFKHLILTRFNTELYSAPARTSLDPDAWMEHRLRLFESFTLPSMAGQSCQDFTWLLAVDSETPDVYMQVLERLCLANMKLVPAKAGESVWLYDVELGPYDLLTTRIDNDDAFHHDAVAALHKAYHEQQAHLPRPLGHGVSSRRDTGSAEPQVLDHGILVQQLSHPGREPAACRNGAAMAA